MPLPPYKTIAGPSTPALNALMSWLDPRPVKRAVDGIEQPVCSNGQDVVRNLQMPKPTADALAKNIDVWLSIGRMGSVPIPETIDASIARIIMARLKTILPKGDSVVPPVIGTPVKEGLSKGSHIEYREFQSGRIARRKGKAVKKAGERGGHVIGYTKSNQPIYASNHEKNLKAVEHMKRDGASMDGVKATAEAYRSYSKKDHLDAALAHAEHAGTTTDREERHGSHMMSQAHATAAMSLSSIHKSMASVAVYRSITHPGEA